MESTAIVLSKVIMYREYKWGFPDLEYFEYTSRKLDMLPQFWAVGWLLMIFLVHVCKWNALGHQWQMGTDHLEAMCHANMISQHGRHCPNWNLSFLVVQYWMRPETSTLVWRLRYPDVERYYYTLFFYSMTTLVNVAFDENEWKNDSDDGQSGCLCQEVRPRYFTFLIL